MERKEAIEVIKKNWPDSSFTRLREALETLIPELKDEDERIRKDIVTYLKSTLSNKKYGDKVIESWIAWLEKQGDKTAWSEDDKNRINRLIAYFEDKESFTAENDVVYANWLKALKDRYAWKPSEEHFELEEFAKIVRGNLTGISKVVQKLFEAKYLQLTGKKMYGGFKD